MPAGFRIRARHVEPAERMAAHHRSGALAIQIEVADEEVFSGLIELFSAPGIDRSGQPEFRVVGDFQGVFEVLGFNNGEDRAEDFLLGKAGFGRNVGDDGRLDKVTGPIAISGFSAGPTLIFSTRCFSFSRKES